MTAGYDGAPITLAETRLTGIKETWTTLVAKYDLEDHVAIS